MIFREYKIWTNEYLGTKLDVILKLKATRKVVQYSSTRYQFVIKLQNYITVKCKTWTVHNNAFVEIKGFWIICYVLMSVYFEVSLRLTNASFFSDHLNLKTSLYHQHIRWRYVSQYKRTSKVKRTLTFRGSRWSSN